MTLTKLNTFECSAVLNGCEIELTNYCGLDCFGCIRKNSKSFGYMKFDTLIEIIDFIKKKNYSEIVLSGLGDVFLHKELYTFIDYIFNELPKIKIYIMTKGQSIFEKDIDRILEYKNNNFNLNITYSIFSLKNSEYLKTTGGGDLNKLLNIIKYSYEKKIDFSFEFLLNKNNIQNIKKYIFFSKIFNKKFIYSIPHNWGGNLSESKYNTIYDSEILKPIITRRLKGEKCEAFIGDYLFFDYLGYIYKCGLKRFDNSLLLGNINNIDLIKDPSELNYDECKKCSYYKYKTKIG